MENETKLATVVNDQCQSSHGRASHQPIASINSWPKLFRGWLKPSLAETPVFEGMRAFMVGAHGFDHCYGRSQAGAFAAEGVEAHD